MLYKHFHHVHLLEKHCLSFGAIVVIINGQRWNFESIDSVDRDEQETKHWDYRPHHCRALKERRTSVIVPIGDHTRARGFEIVEFVTHMTQAVRLPFKNLAQMDLRVTTLYTLL